MVEDGTFSDSGFLPFLLGSVSPAAFIDEYWGRKPLLVKGQPGKFSPLFSRALFERLRDFRSGIPPAMEFMRATNSYKILAIFADRRIDQINRDQIDAKISAGGTIH